jgi:hypothetical protein
MAKHEVKLTTDGKIEVSNADFAFEVHEDGEKLGTLKVSKGSVDWLPHHNEVTHYELYWAEVDKLFLTQGRKKTVPRRRGRLGSGGSRSPRAAAQAATPPDSPGSAATNSMPHSLSLLLIRTDSDYIVSAEPAF